MMLGAPLSRIESMYVDSSDCVRIKEGESKWFRIDSGVRQGFIMDDKGGENGDAKEGSKIPGVWKRMEIAWSLVWI